MSGACHIVKEEIGDEVPVGVLITGPYTAATSCYPAEKLFRAMRKSPEKVHRLVQFTTDCLIDIYKEFIQEGVLILQCDPLASGTILRKSQYQEFVLPYAKKVNQAFMMQEEWSAIIYVGIRPKQLMTWQMQEVI